MSYIIWCISSGLISRLFGWLQLRLSAGLGHEQLASITIWEMDMKLFFRAYDVDNLRLGQPAGVHASMSVEDF